MSKRAIFELQGGIGKHVAFTGALDAYKKANPETQTIVVSAWPEIFTNNEDVDRLFLIGQTPYFYQDYVYNRDVDLFLQEPYRQTTHIKKECSLIETWCKMFDVPYENNLPKLMLNSPEMEAGSIHSDKPILLFQPFGGPGKEHQQHAYSWMRDIHPNIAQELVDVFSQKYHVVHVCYESHPRLNNCQRFDKVLNKKALFAMLTFANQRVLIDSSLQHAAAGLGLQSHVCWFATQAKVFGYNFHHNYEPITPIKPEGTIDSYLYDYNFTGAIHECPFTDHSKLIDYNKLIENVMS